MSSKWFALAVVVMSLLFVACLIEEDLRINGDGSGTYRVRITVPKELGGLGELRRESEKQGFTVLEEGSTEQENFIVVRKEFTDISSLSDSGNTFELTTTETGFLRRDYSLRIRIGGGGFTGFKRRMVITMPAEVKSTTAGESSGNRITWENAAGSLEATASGLYVPLSRNQRMSLLAVAVLGLLLIVAVRRARTPVPQP